ncbi:MAG: methylmalonyl-CoA mutase family protein, partial [Bacteroidia bacterium]
VRVTVQALAAVLGGTQSLHTNGFDEALGLPTENAARIALRTQQVIAFESGVTETVDPLGGSFFIEQLTDEVEAAAWEYISQIDAMGGSVNAIEKGFMQSEIAASSYRYQTEIENGEKTIVGLNKFQSGGLEVPPLLKVDDAIRKIQIEKIRQLKSERDQKKVETILTQLEQEAKDGTNLMPRIIEAVENYLTLGEISDTFRKVFGEYKA